jgi:hypothetical protein
VSVARGALSAAGQDQQKAAPLGLFVLLLLGVACYFLFKSMSRHLKRVREDFPAAATPTRAARTGPVVAGPVTRRPTVAGSAVETTDQSDGDAGAAPGREAAASVDEPGRRDEKAQ